MPTETLLLGSVEVGDGLDGRAIRVVTSPFDTYVIPLPGEQAEKIGNALSAPHVEVAGAGALAGLERPA